MLEKRWDLSVVLKNEADWENLIFFGSVFQSDNNNDNYYYYIYKAMIPSQKRNSSRRDYKQQRKQQCTYTKLHI